MKKFQDSDDADLLDSKTVAGFLGVSVSFLNNKAVSGGGPRYRKIGNKRKYRKIDVLDWLDTVAPVVEHTSSYPVKNKIGEDYAD